LRLRCRIDGKRTARLSLTSIWSRKLTEGVDALVARVPNGGERLRQHILRSHTSAEDAGRIAAEAGVGRLALNHLIPDGIPGYGEEKWEEAVRRTWSGPLSIGFDGLTMSL
jgi:ribonuclease BN (tRNA processing enzyme)